MISADVRLSVVTVVRNAVESIERCLRSVAGQDHPGIEHIIIDGGSTDGTLAVLERWRPRLASLVSEPDGGIYDAMNKGLARATGAMICMLNADDWFAGPGVCSTVVRRYAAWANVADVDRPHMVAVMGDFLLWMPEQRLVSRRRAHAGTRTGMRLNHQSLFIHRDVHTAIGGYDLSRGLAADFDLVMRMEQAGVEILPVAEPFAVFAKGGMGDRHAVRFLLQNLAIQRQYRGLLGCVPHALLGLRNLGGRFLAGSLGHLGCVALSRRFVRRSLGAGEDTTILPPWCAMVEAP